ncbi:hypothetical protein SPJ221_189 [Staphylococcus phage vB_SauH_SPJ2]|nr:hypothetical protein LSA2308_00022 [Staphylococcus phage LSA2308]USZ62810.1 hypothetical protein LSA2311_orf00002 [Staphylococcus phage LSA2311]WEW53555.1 hypothetical protein SPJ221_6 [Staphylococcus phage vB_SauH_SPJ2]BBI90124.1 hypothetical protein MRS_007 [Staphylococcus phage MR003]QQO38222.1 hypothetical protein LSA2308_00202 [Staphylococcus phage LSA2308]
MEKLQVLNKVLENRLGIKAFTYSHYSKHASNGYIYSFHMKKESFTCHIVVYDVSCEGLDTYRVKVLDKDDKVHVSTLDTLIESMYDILLYEYDKYLKDKEHQNEIYSMFDKQLDTI